jgi:hypothetical protein
MTGFPRTLLHEVSNQITVPSPEIASQGLKTLTTPSWAPLSSVEIYKNVKFLHIRILQI